MSSPNPLRRFLLPALLFLGAIGAVLAFGRGQRSNLVVICVDSLRADALSDSAGAPRTPNLDALVADGVAFKRMHASSPSTLEATASLLASQRPDELLVDAWREKIGKDVPNLATALRSRGYTTRAVLAHEELVRASVEGAGLDRGFQRIATPALPERAAEEQVAAILPELRELDGSEPFFLFAQFADPREPYSAHGTQVHKAEILFDGEWIRTLTTSENCFWEGSLRVPTGLHMFQIQSLSPFRLRALEIDGGESIQISRREEDLKQSGTQVIVTINNDAFDTRIAQVRLWMHDAPPLEQARERYRLEVEAVDRAIGELVAELERLDLLDDTVIAVVGSHGEALGERGVLGHDVALYGEMLRVPFVIKPQKQNSILEDLRAHASVLGRTLDVAPTLLAILGFDAPDSFQGTSLAEDAERPTIAQTHPPRSDRSMWSIRDDHYALQFAPGDRRFEMFDLQRDPLELDDVFSVQGAQRTDWQQVLRELARSRPLIAPPSDLSAKPTNASRR